MGEGTAIGQAASSDEDQTPVEMIITDDSSEAITEIEAIEDLTPVEVVAEESASSDELPSDSQMSNETTTDVASDGITATEVIEEIFASPEEKEAEEYFYVETDEEVP